MLKIVVVVSVSSPPSPVVAGWTAATQRRAAGFARAVIGGLTVELRSAAERTMGFAQPLLSTIPYCFLYDSSLISFK